MNEVMRTKKAVTPMPASASTFSLSARKNVPAPVLSPGGEAPTSVYQALDTPGQPIDGPTRMDMEARFGHDFSRVRVHADARAAESARAVNAVAYTVGQDVVFGAGQFKPGASGRIALLAHELVHTLQQKRDAPRPESHLSIEPSHGPLEDEAIDAARQISRSPGLPPPRLSTAIPSLQRQATTVDVELQVPTLQEAQRLRQQGINLPRVSAASADPRNRSDYIDRRITAVGYGIYLGGYHIYCEGLSLPVFVPEAYVDLTLTNAARINDSVYPSRDAAVADMPYGPWPPGQAVPYAFFLGAGGALVVPTVFSPATTPRVAQTMLAARRELASTVERELAVLAISMVGGFILRQIFSRLARLGQSRPTSPRLPTLQRIRPVQGRINVGGGFERGAESATNLNPIVPGTGGPGVNANIPNHVSAGFEEIGDIFEPGSANLVFSNRLTYETVNWASAASGTARVMAPGGRFSLNVWTTSESEVQTIIDAFTRAGFRNVRNDTGLVGPGTIIKGVL